MDDIFSADISFQRICLSVIAGVFIITFTLFTFWSIYVYLPAQQRIKEAKLTNDFAKEFYTRKGLPVPENVANPVFE